MDIQQVIRQAIVDLTDVTEFDIDEALENIEAEEPEYEVNTSTYGNEVTISLDFEQVEFSTAGLQDDLEGMIAGVEDVVEQLKKVLEMLGEKSLPDTLTINGETYKKH